MQLNPSEISELIKKKIENFDVATESHTEGTVVSLTDGIARIHGLSDAMSYEMLEFPDNVYGLALNLERDSVGAVILGEYKNISEGDPVKCTGNVLQVPTGEGMLGRVVDALGNPLDGKGPIENPTMSPIEKVAPGVIERKSVDQPVQTGIKAIDAMVPIGRGQRELIIGDRQTGKSAIAIDAIINQKDTGVKCVYVVVGQKNSTIAQIVRKLEEHDALAHTDGKTYAGDLGKAMSLPPVLLNYSQLERVKTEGIRDAGVLQEIVEQFFNDNGNNDQISIGLQYLVNGEGGGLTDDQAVFATLASYLSNVDPNARPTLLRAYAERLVPVSGRPQIEATQIASVKQELQNQQSDDFEFKILGETGLLQDQFPVVDLMFNQLAVGNLTNTSYATFNDRIINNIIAETVADGGDARAAADSINNFTDRFMKPYFGIPSAVEHQGNYIGVTLHPLTVQELVDPEQGFGRSPRILHNLAKNLLPLKFDLDFTDETGFENLVSVDQSKFNTRSITDVTESVLAATLAHAYTSYSLDLTSYYRTMGQEGADFTGEYKKNFNDGHAFITGAVKNQYISSTNIFGAPTEGAVQKSIVKVGHGKLYGVDVYIPMYLDSISGKYTQFTDLRDKPVVVPVAVVNHSIQRFNRDKNKVLFWQAQDLKGPYQSKASMYLNYIDPDMKQGSSRITGSGPIQRF